MAFFYLILSVLSCLVRRKRFIEDPTAVVGDLEEFPVPSCCLACVCPAHHSKEQGTCLPAAGCGTCAVQGQEIPGAPWLLLMSSPNLKLSRSLGSHGHARLPWLSVKSQRS